MAGGIAAYKAAELCRLLRKAGATTRVVMTKAACRFITPLTMQTLSGVPVARDLFDLTEESEIGHIRLADEADLIVAAPATADLIARLAAGMADDLLTTVILATQAPILLAPAMNVNMWSNPLTQANLARLRELGRVTVVGPDSGDLACGWVGAGRLIEPADIADAAATLLLERRAERSRGGDASSTRDLAGTRVVVTAGPTFEPIDDVRFIGNRSSGKMGFAIAAAAAARGATVTLIAGPVWLTTPRGVGQRIDVETAAQMREAITAAAPAADVVIMAAAVADFRPAAKAAGKLSRRRSTAAGEPSGAPPLTLALEPNPDLLAELGRARRGGRPVLVGFAAETGVTGEALAARAREKLLDKGCDLVAANDVSTGGVGFGGDDTALTLVYADGRVEPLTPGSKTIVADALCARIAGIIPSR